MNVMVFSLLILFSVPSPRLPSRIRVEPIPQQPSPWFTSTYEEDHFPWSGRYRRQVDAAQRKGDIKAYRKMTSWISSNSEGR